jgi:hypothetical protein
MAVVARNREPSCASLTSVRRLTCSPSLLCSSPIVAFRLAETRCITRCGGFGFRASSHFGAFGSGDTSFGRTSFSSEVGGLLYGGLPPLQVHALRCVGSRPPTRRASVLRVGALPSGSCVVSAAWRRVAPCFGRASSLGDVEVRSLLQTRASPSWLFPRMRRSRRSSACTASLGFGRDRSL